MIDVSFTLCVVFMECTYSVFSCLQKAHVQQFVATEDELNKAAEARSTCQKLLRRLYGSLDIDPSHSLGVGGASQTMSSLRQLEVTFYETIDDKMSGLGNGSKQFGLTHQHNFFLLSFCRERCLFVQLDVWTKEREAAGLKASLTTLMSEVQRLNMLCEERKEAEDSLKKKWKKIEEFDARRLELKSIYSALLRANMVR